MPDPLVLSGVRVVDARGVRYEHTDLVIAGQRIDVIGDEATSADARRIDFTGMTVVPGLMNAHAHVALDGGPDPVRTLSLETRTQQAIRGAGRLAIALRTGVTTIRDLGGPDGVNVELAAMIAGGELPGPRMLAAGRVVTMTGGHGHWMGVESDGPDAVRRSTRQQIRDGATAIKVMATGGMMTGRGRAGVPQLTLEEMSAAVEEAHKVGLPVAAHAEGRRGILNAIRAGVDSIEHGHGGDTEAIDLMLEHGTALVPTILSDQRTIEGGVTAGIPVEVVEQCKAMADQLIEFVELAIANGVKVAAGNDGGTPLVAIGEIVPELQLYVEHGMTPLQALGSATTATAELLRLPDVGLIEPGFAADLLVVRGDPLVDIGALAAPVAVFRAGVVVPVTEGLPAWMGTYD